MPDSNVVELDRASRDLTGAREAEKTAEEASREAELRAKIDRFRSGEPEPQEQPQTYQPQPEQPAEQEQARPARSKAWEDPEVIAEVSAYAQQTQAAVQGLQQQYINELAATAGQATAAMFVAFPELAGLQTQDQLLGAFAAIQQQNPQRAEQLKAYVQNVTRVSGKLQEVQQAQVQAQQQQHRQAFDYVAKLADDHFEKWAATQDSPEQIREVASHAQKMLLDGGLTKEELNYHWSTSPLLRSALGQQLLYKAAKWDMAQAAVKNKAFRPVPTVQRPGSPASRATEADYNLSRYNDELNRTGSAKAAAALLQARRANRR
jgi:hypothetical protein